MEYAFDNFTCDRFRMAQTHELSQPWLGNKPIHTIKQSICGLREILFQLPGWGYYYGAGMHF